jgi:hypothetical protein
MSRRKQSRRTQRALERALFGPVPVARRAAPKPKATVAPVGGFPCTAGDCWSCGNTCDLAYPGDEWTCLRCGVVYVSTVQS